MEHARGLCGILFYWNTCPLTIVFAVGYNRRMRSATMTGYTSDRDRECYPRGSKFLQSRSRVHGVLWRQGAVSYYVLIIPVCVPINGSARRVTRILLGVQPQGLLAPC